MLAKFHVAGKGALEEIIIDEQFVELPNWIGDLSDFIVNRRAPKQREHIAKLLELSGCNTIYG